MREKLIARPWQPQDLIDDLQSIIDEECDNYLNTRRTTLCMARDYLKEHFAKDNNVPSKWIPVTERLPEKWQHVLAASKCGDAYSIDFDHICSTGEWYGDLETEYKVTYWMPLPEPPKGE